MNCAIGFDWNIRIFGPYEALVCGDRTYTNVHLRDYASRLASALQALDLRPGARVAAQLPSGPEFVIALEAALRGGFVFVPLSVDTPISLRQRLLEHCGADALIAASGLHERDTSSERKPPHCIAVNCDPASRTHVPDFWDVIARHAPLTRPVRRRADDEAIIQYSSGTTGTPKGVIRTHGHFGGIAERYRLADLLFVARSWAAERQRAVVDRLRVNGDASGSPPWSILIALPLSHRYGGEHLLCRMSTKMRIVLLERFDPHALLAAVERYRIQVLPIVPSFAEALLSMSESFARYDLSSLRRVTVGGAPSARGLIEALTARLGVRVDSIYGMTEGGGTSTGCSPHPKPGSVGRPLPGNRIRVVNDHGEPVNVGETGEIEVQTAAPFAGYVADPEASAKARNGDWRRTGDLGYCDVDGDLFHVGRTDDLIIQGGTKIAPHDVDRVLHRIPGVREAAVVGVAHSFLGEQVVASVVRQPGVTLTSDEVIAECRRQLAAHKTPVAVRFVDALPKDDFGKVRRKDLRQMLEAQSDEIRETDFSTTLRPQSRDQQRALIAHAIVERLGNMVSATVGDVPASIDTTFPLLEQGLTSFDLVRLASSMTELLGRRVDVTAAFNHPTVDMLSNFLADEIFERQPRGDRRETPEPPIDAVGDFVTDALFGRHLSSEPISEGVAKIPQDAIAIVGIGCRFPGGVTDHRAYWTLLCEAIDVTATHPPRAALLCDVDGVDTEFFSIPPTAASRLARMDRLVLLVAQAAIEDAGLSRDQLAAVRAGVYIGAINGGAKTAGMLSHCLNLRGPSMVVDTACSSSLVAIHLAVEALRRGECDVAIGGGVQVLESDAVLAGAAQSGLLAADGRCKAFDAAADGFGLAEGCGLVVLKRIPDALASGDPITAVIRGSAMNHDGRSAMPTAPNGVAQEELIRMALAAAGIEPSDVDYLEAHGSGTELGDAIEGQAAMEVFAEGRIHPLVVGSVKTNIGHTMGAAGIAGLIKAALCVEHGLIPPNLHFTSLNPLLAVLGNAIEIPTRVRRWPDTAGRGRVAAVTSIGLYGTNAHVVIEEAPRTTSNAPAIARELTYA